MALAVGVLDVTALQLLQTGDGLQQFLLPGACNARNTQDLAGIGLEGSMGQHLTAFLVDDGDVLHIQLQPGIDRIGTLNVQHDLFAHHHLRQAHFGGVAGVDRTHILTLAQHRHTVRQGEHLIELMGDDDNGVALLAHVAQHLEELLSFLWGQNGRRLVQDQDMGAAVEHLDDFNRLLLADGHLIDLAVQVQFKTVLVQQLLDVSLDGLQIQSELARQTEDDVFRRSQHIHQLEMLMNHTDAQIKGVFGRADDHFPALDVDMARIREVNAGQHVHQGRFARAVFAQHRKDFALADGHGDILIGDDGTKALGNAAQFNQIDILVALQRERLRYRL